MHNRGAQSDSWVRGYVRGLAAADNLRDLQLLRRNTRLQHAYAESLVRRLLDLTLDDERPHRNVDAWDSEGRAYKVKCRTVADLTENTSFDFPRIDLPFDYLAGVLLHRLAFDVLAVLRVEYDVVRKLGCQTLYRFSFRWNRGISEDPRVERLFWTGDEPPWTVISGDRCSSGFRLS